MGTVGCQQEALSGELGRRKEGLGVLLALLGGEFDARFVCERETA